MRPKRALSPLDGAWEMRSQMTGDSHLLSTGIPRLDDLLAGGIPSRQVLLIAGQPGSGKTILASQIAFAQAARGVPILMATATSEPHTKILDSLQGFRFFQRERVGKEIFLLSIYPWLRKGVRETREMLLSSVRERKARLLVVDGIRSLREVWNDEASIREFLAEVGVGLATNDCTGVLTLEESPEQVLEMPEAATVDGVVTLSFEEQAMRRVRRLEVLKLRGRRHLDGQHGACVDEGGLSVFPRIESQPAPKWQARSGRTPFGVESLDLWIGGGLPAGGVALLAGAPGSGKTLLSASFAQAGVTAKQPTVLVSLQEPIDGLLARAHSVCIPIEPGEFLEAWSPDVDEEDPDGLVREILDRAQARGAQRIVVTGIDALEQRVEPERRTMFLAAMARQLHGLDRDVLLTHGSEDVCHSPLARQVDNLLSVRISEEQGVSRRELRALKIRAGAAPVSPWRFHISDKGCHAG